MDIITGIRKERGRYRVTVNDSEDIIVPLSLLRERPLKEGQPIDLAEYDNWLMLRQYRHALDRAVAYLASRARSRREVEQKLQQAGYKLAEIVYSDQQDQTSTGAGDQGGDDVVDADYEVVDE